MKIDLKEIINPFILLPLILLITYLFGLRDLKLFQYAFIAFLLFSVINNLQLVIFKIVRKRLYLFFYGAMIFSLFFVIPLFYLIKIENPLLNSFFILGITDFIIQGFYNITNRKDGKEIINAWKKKLIKSERVWFHPVSLQKYLFKDFTVSIVDSESINPTNMHIVHVTPLKFKNIPPHIYGHQYVKPSYLFHIYLNNQKNNQKNYGNQTSKGMKINPFLMKELKKLNKDVSKHIITAYRQGDKKLFKNKKYQFTRDETAFATGSNNLKIVIEKEYVKDNPKRVYSFLAKCNKFFASKSE